MIAVAVDEGKLRVEDGTSITVSGANGCGISSIDASTVTMTGGTVTASGGTEGIFSGYGSTLEVSGGTVSSAEGYAVEVSNGMFNISGGTISSESSSHAAILVTASSAETSNSINIADSGTNITSVCDKTISIGRHNGDGVLLSLSLYGKTIYGSEYGAIDIKGATVGSKHGINSTNYTSATLNAWNYKTNYTFDGWSSDKKGKTVISSKNGDTISNLIEKSNTIYLKELGIYSVKGTVSAGTTGVAVNGLTVALYASSDTGYAAPLYMGIIDSDGKYTITAVPNGSYIAVVIPTGGSAQASAPFTVEDDNKLGINITFTVPEGADYIITGGPTSFKVGGNGNYSTLADALKDCTNKGSDGVLTIQLGDGGTALKVDELSQSGSAAMTKNGLKEATYCGSVEIQDTSVDGGFGLVVSGTGVIFDGLAVTSGVTSTKPSYAVYVMAPANLTVKGASSITASSGCVHGVLNRGTFTMSGGQVSAAASGSYGVLNCRTFTISGGQISTDGSSSCGLVNEGTATVSGGSFTGTGAKSYCIDNLNSDDGTGTLAISGGTFLAKGQESISVNNAGSLTISGSPDIASTSPNTILMGKSKSASTELFGKTIHGSTDCDISVKGADSSGSYKLSCFNYANASLIAFNLSSEKSFAAWTSDAAFNNGISTTNGDTISKLTTGDNSAVTNIYLKTGADTSVVLASGSLGKAGKQSITDLTAGKKYKVTMGAVTYYAKADGTLSPLASDAAALTGTEIKGLTNGAAYKVEAISSGGEAGSGGSYTPTNSASVVVDGKTQTAGTVETTTQGGRTATTVTITSSDIKNILSSAGSGATVTLPITTGADMASGRLNGQAVKAMEAKDAILVIKTGSATYTLPASEIKIDSVSEKLGEKVSLGDITVNVTISKPSDTTAKVVESAAQNGGYSLVAPAVEFKVSCTYGGRTVEVSTFNSYVERLIAIPNGVDPSKITTGIVVDPDGTTHHVPTEIIIVDGKYYAKINSLTNSVYSVIYNPVEFSDPENHWAKASVNNIGSRLVVNGVGNNKYEPDRSITRAEFAAVMVKALGLEPGTGTNGFDDVPASAWYCGYVATASSYGIIKGYNSKVFGPSDSITREQAMTMVARAMKITGLKLSLTESQISELLAAYADGANTSSYAKESIAACLKTGIISGTSEKTLSPKDSVTRAEVAVMAERLLEKSKLI